MSIEQTDQLIQLILNSVVMVVACTVLLSMLSRRYALVSDRLQQLQHEYFDILRVAEPIQPARLALLKSQLNHLRRHHRSAHHSMLAGHYALLFLASSTFLIALRTMLATDSLITIALILFIVGVGVLLLGIGLTLCDLHGSDRSIWSELRWLLNGHTANSHLPNPLPKARRSRRAHVRKASQLLPITGSPSLLPGESSQTRVG